MISNGTSNDRVLIDKIVEGDEKAFSELFFQYLPILQAFALKFTKDQDDAKEIIQDSFLRLWVNRDKLAFVENIKAYLYKYVSNECLGYLKKKLRDEKLVNIMASKNDHAEYNTLNTIQVNEVTRIIAQAVDKLPSQRKKIYHLSRSDGKSIPEIAELLGISPNTVKNALVQSLKFIRSYLEQYGITMVLPFAFTFFKIK